jgi:Predicted membrane protein/domain
MNARIFRIRTPEGVVFSQVLAGPIVRSAAWLVDVTVVLILTVMLSWCLLLIQFVNADLAAALQIVLYFAISISYGMATEWAWKGQTLGKKLLRLRVMDAEGLKLHFHQIVIRNLLRFADVLPLAYAVGGLACTISPRYQRLGDLAANTIVVRLPQIAEPEFEKLAPPAFNSLRQHPHLAARLRQRVETTEAALAVNALLRRDDFDSSARVTLYQELADFFREKVAFPPEVTEGLSDEQYVRNVVDVLYRPRTEE